GADRAKTAPPRGRPPAAPPRPAAPRPEAGGPAGGDPPRRSPGGGAALITPVVLIPGDGIGPEVTAAMRAVLAAAGARVSWVEAEAGLGAFERLRDPLPAETLDAIRRHRVALKGPCTTPVGKQAPGKDFRSINVRLRQELDLYASVRPVRSLPGIKVPYEDVDLVVVRENTEGLYSGLEHVVVPGVVESLRIITRGAC